MFEFNDCHVMMHCFVVPKRLLDVDDLKDYFDDLSDEDENKEEDDE